MQISEAQKVLLEKQGYRFIGNHSSVKVCGWTKNILVDKGRCYKYVFYGIRSHQCLQMTTSMYCANRCIFCWRSQKSPVSEKWYGETDKPAEIIDGSISAHLDLLEGYHGNPKANLKLLKEMKDVKHVALSLTGEPIVYPFLNEILSEFHKRLISTFLVTNGQYPLDIEKVECVTQFYLSVDGANKEELRKIDKPLFPDYYDRLLKSLDIMAKKRFRKAIRITIIKGMNDSDLSGYKELIERGQPDFIEIKAYMHIGESIKYLNVENMPRQEYIREISEKLVLMLPDYEISDEHEPSRVVLLIKKTSKPYRYIHFDRFFEEASRGISDIGMVSSDRMEEN